MISVSVGALTDVYYKIVPISQLSGSVIKADTEAIVVHLRALKRYAPSCQYLMLRARTIDVGGEYESAQLQLLDQPASGAPLPEGMHDVGIWRIVPRSDGIKVVIAPMYDCGGRVVWGGGVELALP